MAKEGSSSDRIHQIEERLLAHKRLASIACAVIAVLVLLPVYAERVAEPADANAGTGCWVVQQYSVNAARRGGGVYREVMGWLDDAILPPCCQSISNQTTLFIPYDDSYAMLIATVVAVFSTLVCYCTPILLAALVVPWNPCVLFAVDSIINDMALAVLALTDAAGDAEAARDASGLRVGVTDDSPGLELSDGAVLS